MKQCIILFLISTALIHGMDNAHLIDMHDLIEMYSGELDLLELNRPKENNELRDFLRDTAGEGDNNDSKNINTTHQRTFDLKATLNKEDTWPRVILAQAIGLATAYVPDEYTADKQDVSQKKFYVEKPKN
jgi:hypothetical protein